MKLLRHSRCWKGLLAAALCIQLAVPASAQKIPFRRAIELALTHSAGMGIARADEMKAQQGYLASRNTYIPQITFGSGLGKSFGYPMSIEGSAPSVFNINSQSFLFNPAQRQFLRAAKSDWNASKLTAEDQRSGTILETALTYIQLDQATAKLATVREQVKQAEQAETISRERLKEGVDSQLDVTRASLVAARVHLRQAEVEGNVDLLRQRMAQLTGLDPSELETDIASIPPLPEFSKEDDITARALQNSPALKAAEARALAQEQRAKGEHRQLYPAIDLVGNYGLFTKYNNLDLLFPQGRFERHNATVGVAIRFPFLNTAQRATARVADAEALRAKSEAKGIRDQISSDTLKLQRTVQHLKAARDVAQLELQLAQADLDAMGAKIQMGQATIKDQENARIEATDKQAALADAQFELDRARLQLLRQSGELQDWALR